MNKEDLKLLAEWIEWDIIVHLHKSRLAYEAEYHRTNIETPKPFDEIFHPHLDSNQLDLLEDKMIKESGSVRIEITFRFGDRIVIQHWDERKIEEPFHFESDIVALGEGKTKNEARLNAILNYIRRTNEN